MFGFFLGGGDKCSVFFKMWLFESMSFCLAVDMSCH